MGAKRTSKNSHPISEVRRVLGLSQAEFSKQIGGSHSLLGKIEVFHRAVPRDLSNRILEHYGAWIPPGTYEDVDHTPFPIEGDALPHELLHLERSAFLFASNYEDWRDLATELGALSEVDHSRLRFHRELHRSFGKVVIPRNQTPKSFDSESKDQVLGSELGGDRDAGLRSGYPSTSQGTEIQEIFKRTFRLELQLFTLQSKAGSDYKQYERLAEEFREKLFQSHLGKQLKGQFERLRKTIESFFPGLQITAPKDELQFVSALIGAKTEMHDFLYEALDGWCSGFGYLQGIRALQRCANDGDIEATW